MKEIKNMFDEIPVTKEGLKIYIYEIGEIIKPVRRQLAKYEKIQEEAKRRLRGGPPNVKESSAIH